jgi:hypothetical protein
MHIVFLTSGVMNKRVIVLALVFLVLFSIIIGGILWIHLGGNESSAGKLYIYPLSVQEKTYIVTIRSNYSSAPTVNLPQVPDNYIEFDFRGPPEDSFCNITIPNDLIWGELTVIDKYYVMDKANYIQTNNSTNTSIYFTFNHITHVALDKHFEIRGTEGGIA